MKRIFSILVAAMLAVAMISCEEDPINGNGNGNNGNNGNGGNNNSTTVTDTTIMSYTLMRSLMDIDWDVACSRVLAMGFNEITPDEDNTRTFFKGNLMGDYYTVNIRCDGPAFDNLVGGVVMDEHHLNSSNQATCLENNIYFIGDQRRVLNDMWRDTTYCGGNILYGDLQDNGEWDSHELMYPHDWNLDDFIADSRALSTHQTVTANWANTYIYNNMRYTASCSAISNTQQYASTTENVLALANESRLVKGK